MKVLVDSSVWIDFFNGQNRPHTAALETIISRGEDICICGHILAEVLRGCRHDHQYKTVETKFQILQYLPMNASRYQKSADLYRTLRSKGVTLKNVVDTFSQPLLLRAMYISCTMTETSI